MRKTVGNAERKKKIGNGLMQLELAEKKILMIHSASAAKLFTRADVEKKVLLGPMKHENNLSHLLLHLLVPPTEGMVQPPRGSARARKVTKQQIR